MQKKCGIDKFFWKKGGGLGRDIVLEKERIMKRIIASLIMIIFITSLFSACENKKEPIPTTLLHLQCGMCTGVRQSHLLMLKLIS